MSTFQAEVQAARQAALNAWGLRQALDERDAALARAWALRPGGTTWAQLVDEVCRTLPAGARFSRSTARAAKRQHAVTMPDDTAAHLAVLYQDGVRKGMVAAGVVTSREPTYTAPAETEAEMPDDRCSHPLADRRLSDDGRPYCRTCGADVEEAG